MEHVYTVDYIAVTICLCSSNSCFSKIYSRIQQLFVSVSVNGDFAYLDWGVDLPEASELPINYTETQHVGKSSRKSYIQTGGLGE